MWNIIKLKNPIWYIDATGSIHKKLNCQKAPFLYSAVCNDINKKQTISVFEFVTTSHTSESISKFITFAVNRIQQNPGKIQQFSLAPIVVMDFSFAILNGVLNSINKCSLTEYIQFCYELIFNKKTDLKMYPTFVYLCSTHFLKNIIKKTKPFKSSVNQDVINQLIFGFTLIQNSITQQEIENNMINIYNIFNNKYLDQTVVYSLKALRTELINRDLHRVNIQNISSPTLTKRNAQFAKHLDLSDDQSFLESNKTIITNSPFKRYFDIFFVNMQQNIDKKTVNLNLKPNPYYQPELFNIIRKQMYIIPLWSGIMIYKCQLMYPDSFERILSRLSNNPAEGWFGHLKNDLLENETVLASQLATILYERIQAKFIEFYQTKSSCPKSESDGKG